MSCIALSRGDRCYSNFLLLGSMLLLPLHSPILQLLDFAVCYSSSPEAHQWDSLLQYIIHVRSMFSLSGKAHCSLILSIPYIINGPQTSLPDPSSISTKCLRILSISTTKPELLITTAFSSSPKHCLPPGPHKPQQRRCPPVFPHGLSLATPLSSVSSSLNT